MQRVIHLSSGVWCAYAQVVPQGETMGAVESARELDDGLRYIQLYHGGGGGRFSDIYATLP